MPTEWFRWLPVGAITLFYPEVEDPRGQVRRTFALDRRFGERLAAVDLIRPEERSLRTGWLFVAGRLPSGDGRRRRVLHPLVTVPVRVERVAGLGRHHLVPAGDVELSEMIADLGRRASLEAGIEIGGGALDGMQETSIPTALLRRLPRLHHFARSAAEAADLPAHQLVPASDGPDRLARADSLAIVVGVAVYAIHATGGTSRAGSLRTWAAQPLARRTALHILYLDPEDGHGVDPRFPSTAALPTASAASAASTGSTAASSSLSDDRSTRVESPYLLTPVQRTAVARSRVAPVILISGAPGSGKSHTVAAIACDALARAETVLVAAKTDASVDALVDLLERSPGPDPVLFGSNERREALATRLAGGTLQPVPDAVVRAERDRLDATVARRDELWRTIAGRLDVRRNSAFDVAAGVAPALTLDEHFRSDPHLMQFVSRRLYDGTVRLATRSPMTEARDCVSVVRLDGVRDRDGVVVAEVDRTLRLLQEMRAQGTTSVGVVTPFRAQADALERAILVRSTPTASKPSTCGWARCTGSRATSGT